MSEQNQAGKVNPLLTGLSPAPNAAMALKALLYRPPIPENLTSTPSHLRLLDLLDVKDFHFPPPIEGQLLQTVDLMIRHGYKYRDPRSAAVWASIGGEEQHYPGALIPQSMAACVEGISGVGKTQACLRSLRYHPQVIEHKSFPKIIGTHQQVVWLSIEVPPSGKAKDLARSLMQAWQDATGSARFAAWLSKDKITDGQRALAEWLQVAKSGFLGILHLDEIQNLFKGMALRKRRTKGSGNAHAPELSIVEDETLRWLLSLTNQGHFPLLVSGTPDGIGALSKRLSTLERFNTGGYHRFDRIAIDKSRPSSNLFLQALSEYQYVKHPIEMDEELISTIIKLTAGVQRIVIALWVSAQRLALERKEDRLRLEDFHHAATTALAPLAPVIGAIQRGDSTRMLDYEDLANRDPDSWSRFWSQSGLPL